MLIYNTWKNNKVIIIIQLTSEDWDLSISVYQQYCHKAETHITWTPIVYGSLSCSTFKCIRYSCQWSGIGTYIKKKWENEKLRISAINHIEPYWVLWIWKIEIIEDFKKLCTVNQRIIWFKDSWKADLKNWLKHWQLALYN